MQGVPEGREENVAGAGSVVRSSLRAARRVVIAVTGSLVLLAGIVLLVTPGPAFIVIPIGIGILAIEFAWAQRWLDAVRQRVQQAVGRDGRKRAASSDDPAGR